MAIFTPTGLKIRLPMDYAFALMARLYPKVSAFRVLKTTEVIDLQPSFYASLAFVLALMFHQGYLASGLSVVLGGGFGFTLRRFGLVLFPGQVGLAVLYSYIGGIPFIYLPIAVVLIYFIGWKFVLIYLIARMIIWLVTFPIEITQMRHIFKDTRMAMGTSEHSFINAYRIHADHLGISTDTTVAPVELEEANWRKVYSGLAVNWPKVVSRFTSE